MEKSVKTYSARERIIPVALLIIGMICASWLTVQSREPDGNATVDSIHPVILGDTTGKGKSSRRQVQKVVDVNTVVEVEEIVEADNDELVDMNLTIPPVPPLPDIDIVVPVDIRQVYDFNTDMVLPRDIELPGMIFSIPAHFDLDSIPGDGRGRDWEEFSKEFEMKFADKFGDFYKDHQKELEGLMKELEHQFEYRFDEEWTARMEGLASKQEHIMMSKMDQSRDVWEQEEAMKKFEKDMKRWETENKKQLQMLEDNAKAIEKNINSLQTELRDELIKDGYLDASEVIMRKTIRHVHYLDHKQGARQK